ncbi:MAG: hypothetical protein IPH57_16515 [Saprospiraceae bacterium]|nr:hypothetical protein [Saprospiraceae bacterium]
MKKDRNKYKRYFASKFDMVYKPFYLTGLVLIIGAFLIFGSNYSFFNISKWKIYTALIFLALFIEWLVVKSLKYAIFVSEKDKTLNIVRRSSKLVLYPPLEYTYWWNYYYENLEGNIRNNCAINLDIKDKNGEVFKATEELPPWNSSPMDMPYNVKTFSYFDIVFEVENLQGLIETLNVNFIIKQNSE